MAGQGRVTTRVAILPRPLPHQREILLSDRRFKVVCCGRRFGKTTIGLISVLDGHGPWTGPRKHGRPKFMGALHGGAIYWVAPTFPIAQKIWRDLKKSLDHWDDLDK